jgi:hypothetical protein
MTSRRRGFSHRVRGLGIGLLILSMGHTPLPKADFHNIRHHDGPGQICRYHDHLLRWHPSDDLAEDVAVLHWHWFLPRPGDSDPSPEGQPTAVHSSVPDWSGLSWDDAPQLAPDARARFIGRPALGPLETALPSPDMGTAVVLVRAGPSPIHSFGATFAPRVPLSTLLHRWVC